jgi:Protein of unknown function (DUF1488)
MKPDAGEVECDRYRCGSLIMSLNFPNRSRCYDATLRAVRFWGHDGPMEASFFVNEDALKSIQPEMSCDEGTSGRFRFALRSDPRDRR